MAARKPKMKDRPGNPQREKLEVKKREPKGGKALWWKLDKDWHTEVFATLDYLDQNQPFRALLNRYFRAVFRNRPPLSTMSIAIHRAMGMQSDRLMLNVLKAIINTKKSRVAKNNGRTRFMTNGADYEMRERAQLMEKFCAGLDYQQDTHKQMKRMFTDTEVCGTGAIKVYDDEDRIVTEWTDIDSIVVDEEACVNGETFELHQRVYMPREMALEEFSDILGEAELADCPGDDRRIGSNGVVSDRICIVESWKLPFNSRNTDGLHTISCKRSSFGEEWKSKKFPFAFLRSETTEGFYGEGTGERVNPKSTELNKLLRTSHLSMALGSVPKYFVHDEAEVEEVEINNDVGTIVHWSGPVKPEKEVSNSVPPEMWQRIDWLYSMAFREEGVSEQSAAARKEPGITAAVAMREQSDLETDRMSILSQEYEQARVHVNELQLEAAKRIVKRGTPFMVKFPLGADGYMEIDFKEIDMERDEFVMQPYPASSLPQTPTARAQWIEERMQGGLITPEVGRKLAQMPDIEEEMNMMTAAERDVDRTLDRMMRQKPPKDGKPLYLPPEPQQNLQLAVARATQKYLSLRLIPGVPRDRLELIQRYAKQAFDMAKAKKAEEMAEQMAQQAAMAPPPGAAPQGPMPQSQPALPAGPAVAPAPVPQ